MSKELFQIAFWHNQDNKVIFCVLYTIVRCPINIFFLKLNFLKTKKYD